MDNSVNIYQYRIGVGDPHTNSDTSTRVSILFTIYDALIKRDGIGTYKPGLAWDWSTSSDAKTWVFNLRRNVTFHNGDKFTSQDVVDTFNRFRDPSMEGEGGTKGVYPSYFMKSVASAPDEYTFKLELETPMSDLLDLLIEMPIAPRRHLETAEADLTGTGPYIVEDKTEDLLVVSANKNYWGGKAPYDIVNWVKEGDPLVRLDALNRGEADFIRALDVSLHDQVVPSATIVEKESNVCMVLFFNAQKGACKDIRVRQALNYGFDRQSMLNEEFEGAGYPLESVFSPLSPGYDSDIPVYPYDPEKAKELLKDAGYENGLKLVLNKQLGEKYNSTNVSMNLRKQFALIGVDMEILSYPDSSPGAYSDFVKSKQIDDMAWFDSSPLSSYRVCREKLHSGYKGAWWEGYANPVVDNLVHEIEKTIDPVKKEELFKQIYRETRDDPPWLFMHRPRLFWGVSKKLRNWKPNNDGLTFPFNFPK